MAMDSVNDRDLAVESFDAKTLLSHAQQQAIQCRYGYPHPSRRARQTVS